MQDLTRTGIELDDGAGGRGHDPHTAKADGDAGGPDRGRKRPRRPVAGRVDAGDGPVDGVRDPHEAFAVGDAARAVADRDLLHLPVDRRVDPGDGPVEAVRDPDCAATDCDPYRPRTDLDCLLHGVRRRVDVGDRVVVGVRDPDGVRPDCDAFGEVPTEISETTFPFPESMTPTEFGDTEEMPPVSRVRRKEATAAMTRMTITAAPAISRRDRTPVGCEEVSPIPSAERVAASSSPAER